LKIPTSSVNFDDAEAGKGAFDRIRKKVSKLKGYYQTSRSEWIYHRAMWNRVLTSLHDRHRKTITQTNNEMKKAHTKTQKQQNEIGTNKRKVQKMKNQVKSTKNMAKKI